MTKQQNTSTKNSETYKLTLPSDTQILITRTLDAPREKVWRVITDPRLIPEWWGPRGYTTVVEIMDVRVGGRWRFLLTNPEGIETAFNGVYKEVARPEKLVNTFEFEPMAGHITTEHVTLTEKGKKTFFVNRIECMSAEDRDGIVQSGMEWGSRQTMDKLEELLEKIT